MTSFVHLLNFHCQNDVTINCEEFVCGYVLCEWYLTQVAQTLIGQQTNPLHLFHRFYGEYSVPQQPLSPRRKKKQGIKLFCHLHPVCSPGLDSKLDAGYAHCNA